MRGLTLIVTAILAGSASGSMAQPTTPPPSPRPSCFFVNQFENWKAPDAKTIYIRVNLNKYYRLDLSSECPTLLWPDVHLVMNVRGPDTICSALDWDLKVSQSPPGSIATPCIVKTMTELTPAEAAAIPKKFKP